MTQLGFSFQMSRTSRAKTLSNVVKVNHYNFISIFQMYRTSRAKTLLNVVKIIHNYISIFQMSRHREPRLRGALSRLFTTIFLCYRCLGHREPRLRGALSGESAGGVNGVLYHLLSYRERQVLAGSTEASRA